MNGTLKNPHTIRAVCRFRTCMVYLCVYVGLYVIHLWERSYLLSYFLSFPLCCFPFFQSSPLCLKSPTSPLGRADEKQRYGSGECLYGGGSGVQSNDLHHGGPLQRQSAHIPYPHPPNYKTQISSPLDVGGANPMQSGQPSTASAKPVPWVGFRVSWVTRRGRGVVSALDIVHYIHFGYEIVD